MLVCWNEHKNKTRLFLPPQTYRIQWLGPTSLADIPTHNYRDIEGCDNIPGDVHRGPYDHLIDVSGGNNMSVSDAIPDPLFELCSLAGKDSKAHKSESYSLAGKDTEAAFVQVHDGQVRPPTALHVLIGV